jgi:ribosomal protein S18 acetylase RimI-like enzyme
MHQITLRPASTDDAPFVFHVEERAMRHHAEATWGRWTPAEDPESFFRSFLPEGHHIVLVGEHQSGVLAYEVREDCVYLAKLYLLEAYRSRGLGAQLLDSVVNIGRSTGKFVKLHTLSVNTRAVAFYLRHGFAVESRTSERVHMVASAA